MYIFIFHFLIIFILTFTTESKFFCARCECESFFFIDELKKWGDKLLPEYIVGLITKFEYRKKGLEASAKRDENELDNVNDTISRLRRYLEECE